MSESYYWLYIPIAPLQGRATGVATKEFWHREVNRSWGASPPLAHYILIRGHPRPGRETQGSPADMGIHEACLDWR
ncbi:hypothetical protein PM082_001465 [Marasmius tenuissimus]|nr:hypothetical protein PM082_001465 [Marasmius tenuissimus]